MIRAGNYISAREGWPSRGAQLSAPHQVENVRFQFLSLRQHHFCEQFSAPESEALMPLFSQYFDFENRTAAERSGPIPFSPGRSSSSCRLRRKNTELSLLVSRSAGELEFISLDQHAL